MSYRHETRARAPRSVLIVGAVWAGLLLLLALFNMAWWLALIIALCTLPALWDIVRDRRSVLEVSDGRMEWASSLRSGSASGIDHVRLSRRFDGTLKITIIQVGGKQIRLPPDINPPIDAIEDGLKEVGIAAERHPFSLF